MGARNSYNKSLDWFLAAATTALLFALGTAIVLEVMGS